MQELSANRNTEGKNLFWNVPKKLQTKEELLQSVGLFFFHIHKFKLKTGQQFTPIFL